MEVTPDMEKQFRQLEKQRNAPVPKLRNKPWLNEHQEYMLRVFFRISARRQFGMAPNPLPVEAIIEYGDRFESWCDGGYFFRLMAHLDDAYLELSAKKRENEKDQARENAKMEKARNAVT